MRFIAVLEGRESLCDLHDQAPYFPALEWLFQQSAIGYLFCECLTGILPQRIYPIVVRTQALLFEILQSCISVQLLFNLVMKGQLISFRFYSRFIMSRYSGSAV